MKKVLIGFAAILAVAGAVMAATVTNRLGMVITTSTDSYGVTTTTITLPNSASSVTNRTVLPVGGQIDAAAWVDSTLFTPRNYGDFLIGITTGKLWVATGLTTNDWKILN